jgi:hypothetical protein
MWAILDDITMSVSRLTDNLRVASAFLTNYL